MNQQWWATTDYLYDKTEHLYLRDSTYFDRREANGRRVFWSRGNGWVFAGLARVLEAMPADFQDRPRYVQLYRDMAAKLITVQQPDGLWRASLLDPNAYPAPETSGTGFFCYGLAWGVNRGLFDEATYRPVVARAWQGLVGCVHPDGMLGSVQPIGAAPDKVSPDLTEVYGVGAFLLAGKEVHKMVGRGSTRR
jgi:rhamnogalacturonyl hydrolase YesR